jgi:PAS domain S-box-containing protein
MKKGKTGVNEAVELRRRTEKLLAAYMPESLPIPAWQEMQRLFCELEIYQSEMEKHNAELQKARDEMAVELRKCNDLLMESKRNEDETLRDKALLRCLIDSIGDLIFIKDMNGAYQACNRAGEEFIGLPEHEQIGKTDFDFFDREIAEAICVCDRQIMDSGDERRIEEWIPCRDGGRRLYDTVKAPFYGPDGKQLGLVGIARDITDRKKTEEALLKSERQLAEAQRLAHIGSWEWDAIADEVVESDEIVRIFGRHLSSYDGFLELVHPDDRERVRNAVHQTIAHNSPYDLDYRIIRPDGAIRIIQARGATMTDGSGKTVGMIGTTQDVTERREMEETLVNLHAEIAAYAANLEAANRDLEEFNAAVSHDLRAPLAKINAICQLLMNYYADGLDKAGNEYLLGIHSTTMQMTNLIKTFLNFSRSSHCAINNQTVGLGGIATQIAAQLEMTTPGRRCTFRIAEGVIAEGDPDLLRVVMANLLGNAWKYSAGKEDAVIEFGVMENEGNQVYFVRDNGVGFDMAQSDRIFAPFHRLPGQDGFIGYGLGLATVQRIIVRHGGRTWADSEPGKGATFFFTLGGDNRGRI